VCFQQDGNTPIPGTVMLKPMLLLLPLQHLHGCFFKLSCVAVAVVVAFLKKNEISPITSFCVAVLSTGCRGDVGNSIRDFCVTLDALSDAPTSEPPTSDLPTSNGPTQPPSSTTPTDQPTSSFPSTGTPTSLPPKDGDGARDGPTAVPTENPTSDLPTSDAPTSSIPSDAPTSSIPSEAPTSSSPTSEAPTSSAPSSSMPTSGAPTSMAPTPLPPLRFVSNETSATPGQKLGECEGYVQHHVFSVAMACFV